MSKIKQRLSDKVKRHVHRIFTSNLFPKYPDENKELINENRWGKRLAEWIQKKLPDKGIQTEDILAEDWGWVVNINLEDFIAFIGCGVSDESEDKFIIFIEVNQPFFKKLFRKKDPTPSLEKIKESLSRVLSEEDGIKNIRWD